MLPLIWWLAVGVGLYGGPYNTERDCELAKAGIALQAISEGREPPAMRCFEGNPPPKPNA